MLYKVFDFADKEASDVMVPRPEVVALSVDMPSEEALAAVLDSPYTRYPVYRESVDEIVGILHVRDLFKALNDSGIEHVELAALVRPAPIVPETKDLAALLGEFRRTNQHMAVVVDEYGAMEGIVTLEDLLEEIVGEIEDEFDLPDESVERVDDHTVRKTRITELADEGSRRARAVLRITADPPRFIAAMQLGVTLTSLGIGALGEQVLARLFDAWLATIGAVLLSFLIITFMHVVVGELVPKGIALSYAERVALLVSAPVRGFFVVFKPLIWVLQRSSESLQRGLGIDARLAESQPHSEAELKMLLEVSTEHGEIEQDEREMLYKVFDFADKEASDVDRKSVV